jgi:hypothetical protein
VRLRPRREPSGRVDTRPTSSAFACSCGRGDDIEEGVDETMRKFPRTGLALAGLREQLVWIEPAANDLAPTAVHEPVGLRTGDVGTYL